LPALAVTSPDDARAPSAATLLSAPRSLNEPVSCRHSAFSDTGEPTASDASAHASVAVRAATPRIARRAPSRSALAIKSALASGSDGWAPAAFSMVTVLKV
jgi:hypothetical protein